MINEFSTENPHSTPTAHAFTHHGPFLSVLFPLLPRFWPSTVTDIPCKALKIDSRMLHLGLVLCESDGNRVQVT